MMLKHSSVRFLFYLVNINDGILLNKFPYADLCIYINDGMLLNEFPYADFCIFS
jgi:hypothetical protein